MDQVRREFVSNASHELRTPTAGIKALAEVLQGGALQDPSRGPEFLQQIIDASDRLTAILDDMLVLTRIERGQELLRPVWVEVGQAVGEALHQVQAQARQRDLALISDVPDGDRLYADRGALDTILTNLLDNAVKYTRAAGHVRVFGRQVPGGYEVSVSDTGVGVPEQDQERIFERFYRVDEGRDRASGGTGLGLAIVKHSVEAHGGRVRVRSRLGEGSTFTVFLPEPGSTA
jgi:signal transduction histidine kinase